MPDLPAALRTVRCDVCGHDVPAFLSAGDPAAGEHLVLVEGPVTVEHGQPRDCFERNVIAVRVSMDVSVVLCRDLAPAART